MTEILRRYLYLCMRKVFKSYYYLAAIIPNMSSIRGPIPPKKLLGGIIVILTLLNLSCANNDDIQDSYSKNVKSICLYGDSTFDPDYLYIYLKDNFGFDLVFNRCVPGCGYKNGPVNTVYYFVAQADTAYRLRYGDPINAPSIDKDSLPEGVMEIDAHQYSDERINTIPTNCDIVLIGGGINDISRLEKSDFVNLNNDSQIVVRDYNLFYNCVFSTISKIKQRCPHAKLFVCGISPSLSIYDKGINAQKAKWMDECISHISELFDVPFYSLVENLGWDEKSIMEYTDGIHPNNEAGRKRYAEVVGSFLQQYYPF